VTNRGDNGTAAGRIYRYRPDIDTTWTLDHHLSTGSVTRLNEYGGKLSVGTANVAATFATVLVRDPSDGSYATSLTATGGAATNDNGFLAMAVLDNVLYVSYYNGAATPFSKVYAFNGTTWSTSLSQNTAATRPFMALATELTYLFAIGGGKGVSPILWRFNGTIWEDETAFIDVTHELVPAFGTVVV